MLLLAIIFGASAGIGAVELFEYLRRESPSRVVHLFRKCEPVGDGQFKLIEKRRTLAKDGLAIINGKTTGKRKRGEEMTRAFEEIAYIFRNASQGTGLD